MELTDAQSTVRSHFEAECGHRGLQVFEVLQGAEVPEKGWWELRCRVKCFYATELRVLVAHVHTQTGRILAVREEKREPFHG